MDLNRHVYCMDCINGEALLEAIFQSKKRPIGCRECYPYDPEDSACLALRKNYKEKETSDETGV